MKIAVLSGKGGTGKTTVAVNLAISLMDKKDITLIDCDCEEPNCNLFLNAEISDQTDATVKIPIIDEKKCILCGKCAESCKFNALAKTKNGILFFSNLCHSCGLCSMVCPEKAIEEIDKTIGKIRAGKYKNIVFYEGILNLNEITSVPVIKKVKESGIADESRTIIIDCPPGTSCPVIEAVEDTDFCILVTESTPFGLWDLKLAVEMLKKIGMPLGIAINKWIDNGIIEKYAKEENIPILIKIPLDMKIARMYSEGKLIAEHIPELKNKLITAFDNILTLTNDKEKKYENIS